MRDRPHAAASRDERIPKCFQADPVGSENAHPRNHDTISFYFHDTSSIDSDLGTKVCILIITLNAVIIFFSRPFRKLFTKFSTCSQEASCAAPKKVSNSE